jgi:hypothetical protein
VAVRQAPKVKVARFEMVYVPLFKREIRHAVLDCGHVHNVGPTYTPKRMACWVCRDAA